MELALRERFERDQVQDKIKRAQMQNQQLMDQRKVSEDQKATKTPSGDVKIQFPQIESKVTRTETTYKQEPPSFRPTNNSNEENIIKQEIIDLSKTFKGELEGMRTMIRAQDSQMK